MAVYEFRCEVCSQQIEIQRPIDDLLARDPYCQNCTIPMKRIYSPSGIIFKGQGWGAKP
jgi:putative FmdB family regulatory protein